MGDREEFVNEWCVVRILRKTRNEFMSTKFNVLTRRVSGIDPKHDEHRWSKATKHHGEGEKDRSRLAKNLLHS